MYRNALRSLNVAKESRCKRREHRLTPDEGRSEPAGQVPHSQTLSAGGEAGRVHGRERKYLSGGVIKDGGLPSLPYFSPCLQFLSWQQLYWEEGH